MANDQYPFGAQFQLSILALAFREPKFSTDYNFLLTPTYFDNEEFRHLAQILSDYHTKYAKAPDPAIFHDLVRSYALSKKLDNETFFRIEQVLDRALSIELSDIEFVREEAVRFAKGQLMKSAILHAYRGLASVEDYGTIVDEFQKILEIDSPSSRVLRFSDIASQIPQQFRLDSTVRSQIPTGLPVLDSHMFGGAARGKLGVVLARSGGGKTHLLTFLGSQAIRRGYPVFHFAFGDMDAWEVSLRYAANFTQINSYDIIRGRMDYHTAILDWIQASNKDLFISSYPPDTITPGNLKSIISSMISKTGVHPALIIVDYADNLATGMRQTLNPAEKNASMGVVYQQLLKAASQFDSMLWTGSQVQRAFYRLSSSENGQAEGTRYLHGLIDTDGVAEAIKKMEHADYVLSLNQSREDSDVDLARIYEAKIRFGSDKHIVHVRFDKGTSTFIETGQVEDTNHRPSNGNGGSPQIPPVMNPDQAAIAGAIAPAKFTIQRPT